MAKGKIKGKEPNKKEPRFDSSLLSDADCPIWVFDKIDRDGKFAFSPDRKDFDSLDFLNKMIYYSRMTWADIKQQTHDQGKSKHHTLDYPGLSKQAKDRIEKLKLDSDIDSFFSFAFNNLLRIIGIREGVLFHVLWYDPKHEVFPSTRRHT